MRKMFAAIILFLAFPFFLFAQDTQMLIVSLQKQIAALQEKIAALTVSEPQPISSAVKFERDLFYGQTSEEVRALQEFLAKDPSIYPEGLATGFFGALTEKAVQRFQEKHSIVSSGALETTGYGRVGPKTRMKLNELIAEITTPF